MHSFNVKCSQNLKTSVSVCMCVPSPPQHLLAGVVACVSEPPLKATPNNYQGEQAKWTGPDLSRVAPSPALVGILTHTNVRTKGRARG